MNLCIPTTLDTSHSIRPNWRDNVQLVGKPGFRFKALHPLEFHCVFYQEWLDTLYQIFKIPPIACAIFDRDPEFVDHIGFHRDIIPNSRQLQHYCFNILDDPDPDGELVWYYTDTPGMFNHAPNIQTYELFEFIPDDKIIFRSRLEDQKLYLCNTAIVHNVKMGQHPRTCFSFKFNDPTEWTNTLEIYKNILVK